MKASGRNGGANASAWQSIAGSNDILAGHKPAGARRDARMASPPLVHSRPTIGTADYCLGRMEISLPRDTSSRTLLSRVSRDLGTRGQISHPFTPPQVQADPALWLAEVTI